MSDFNDEYKLATNIWDRASLFIKNKWKENDMSNDILKYRTHLLDTFGTIKIIGMTEPVDVRDIYVDLNILHKTRETDEFLEQSNISYADLSNHRSMSARSSAEKVVKDNQNLFILGKPGAGKTTFLKHLVINALIKQKAQHIPVFIRLKEFSESKTHNTLIEQVINQFETNSFSHAKPFVEKMLIDGEFLILLDGFDEIKISEQNRIIDDIRKFRRLYYKNKFIISCRIHASNYIFEDFTDVELADFNPEQVSDFINKWFSLDKEKSEKCNMILSYNENKGLRELASQPLLLTMICIYFDKVFDFPKNRAELYEEAINILLVTWDSSRKIERSSDIYKKLTPKQKKVLYSEVAGLAFLENQYTFTQDELQNQITTLITDFSDVQEGVNENEVLRSMVAQHGLITPFANQKYAFSHLTFQEFLTANYIQYRKMESELIELYFSNDNWREVFILYSGLLQNSDTFLINLKKKADSFLWNTDTSAIRKMLCSVKNVSDSYETEYSKTSFYILSIARAFELVRTNVPYRNIVIDIITSIAFELDSRIKEKFYNNRIDFYQMTKGLTPKLIDQTDLKIQFNKTEIATFIRYLKSQLLLIICVNSSICISRKLRNNIERTVLSIS